MKRKPSFWGIVNLCLAIFNFAEYTANQNTFQLAIAVFCLTVAIVCWYDGK